MSRCQGSCKQSVNDRGGTLRNILQLRYVEEKVGCF